MRRIALLLLAVGAQAPPLDAAESPAPAKPIAITLFAFAPATVTVHSGDVVEWTNHDLVPHTATGNDGSWSTGEIRYGSTDRFVAKAPGTFAYHCRYHPQMHGVIVVTPP